MLLDLISRVFRYGEADVAGINLLLAENTRHLLLLQCSTNSFWSKTKSHSGMCTAHCTAKHFSFFISNSYFAGTGGRLSWTQVTLQTMIWRWNKQLKMVYSTTHFLQPQNLNHFTSSHWLPRDTRPNISGGDASWLENASMWLKEVFSIEQLKRWENG